MSSALKYAAGVLPGLIWAAAALYKSASGAVAYTLIFAAAVAAIASFPIVILAFIKLWRGSDTAWVVVSLLFSLPVVILSLIAVAVLARNAVASNSAFVSDVYASALCASCNAPQRER
jgi:heme/copper-type cytochrome/quinol oxidase subunit 4